VRAVRTPLAGLTLVDLGIVVVFDDLGDLLVRTGVDERGTFVLGLEQ